MGCAIDPLAVFARFSQIAIKLLACHIFLGCRTKILACRSDTLKPLVDQPDYISTDENNEDNTNHGDTCDDANGK